MTETVLKPIETFIAQTRQQIQPYVFKRLESRKPRQPGTKTARTITVTSGKGGVGKTNITANLAISLAQAGRRVIILDADLGLANMDVVFGIRPKHNLNDVISGSMSLEEILIPGPCGIKLIAGGSGISELARFDEEAFKKLFAQIRFLEETVDYLLIDTGAGIGNNVVSFCLAADQIIVVTTPEPTALADAYGIIKIISQSRPGAGVSVLINRVDNKEEGEFVSGRLIKVARDFLGFNVTSLGSLPQDHNMYMAVRQQTPLLLFSPMSPAATGIRSLVENGFHEQVVAAETETPGIEGFFSRLSDFFRGRQKT
jgi:flagellar biosynthesis protein FlhG